MTPERVMEFMLRKPHLIDLCKALLEKPLSTQECATTTGKTARVVSEQLAMLFLYGLATRQVGHSLGRHGRTPTQYTLTNDGRILATARLELTPGGG